MKANTCPTCGTESARILSEFDRVFPLPAVHVRRYRGENHACMVKTRPGHPNRRSFWDVPTEELERGK